MSRFDQSELKDRTCYRYRTAVLTGPWRRHPQRALQDAIDSGQARYRPDGEAQWVVSGKIEESRCANGPCGGIYPPE